MEPSGGGARTATQPSEGTGSASINTREAAKQRVERWTAEMAGVLEGLQEALDKYAVAERSQEAMQEARRFVQSSAGAVRSEMDTPEGQRLQQGMRRGAATVQETAEEAASSVRHTAQEVKSNLEEAVDDVQDAAHAVMDETKARGQAAAEAGRRAARAPGHIATDMRQAAGSWMGGMVAGLGLFLVAGLVGLAAFIVLTVALVSFFNGAIGAPGGTFLVALLYIAGAIGAVAAARASRRKARQQAEEHMMDARRELTAVAMPLRRAFGRGRARPAEPPVMEEWSQWTRR